MKIIVDSPQKPISNEQIKLLPVFFIIGRPRSGTTLLRTLFDAHPSVVIPLECPLIKHLSDKYLKINNWTSNKLTEFYEDLIKQQKFNTWFLDVEELKKSILSCIGEYSFQDIVKVVYYNYTSFFNKEDIKVLGDKNPSYSTCTKKIFDLFPEAKYIHLTRDYRDNILSILKVDFEAPHIPLIAYRWRYSAIRVDQLKKQYPKSFFTISYEDLVTDPVSHLNDMCDFIGIEYRSEMLDFYKKKDEVMKIVSEESFNKYHSSLFYPVSSAKIYSWKTKMPAHSVKLADLVVGKYASLQGYERKFTSFNLFDYLSVIPGMIYGRFSYLITHVINLLPFNVRMKVRNKGSLLAKSYWFFVNLFNKSK